MCHLWTFQCFMFYEKKPHEFKLHLFFGIKELVFFFILKDEEIVLGAPGSVDWTGTLYLMK